MDVVKPLGTLFACCIAVAALAAGTGSGPPEHRPPTHRLRAGAPPQATIGNAPHWGATGTPLPPPPAWAPPMVAKRFLPLYIAYEHIPAGDKPSFERWLAENGIVHPLVTLQMLRLYAWYEHMLAAP